MKNNQPKSGRGGRREGAGRKAGSPNKWTGSLRDYARQFAEESVDALVTAIRSSTSETARIAAANSILDRGFGKPSQVLTGDEDGGPLSLVTRIEIVGVRPHGVD